LNYARPGLHITIVVVAIAGRAGAIGGSGGRQIVRGTVLARTIGAIPHQIIAVLAVALGRGAGTRAVRGGSARGQGEQLRGGGIPTAILVVTIGPNLVPNLAASVLQIVAVIHVSIAARVHSDGICAIHAVLAASVVAAIVPDHLASCAIHFHIGSIGRVALASGEGSVGYDGGVAVGGLAKVRISVGPEVRGLENAVRCRHMGNEGDKEEN